MADMTRLGLEVEREEIDRLVAAEARRRELIGDTGSQEFYNDKVRPQTVQASPHFIQRLKASHARQPPASCCTVKLLG